MEYTLTDGELQRMSLHFRQIASRLLRTDFREGMDNLRRFIDYIDSEPLIADFIRSHNVETHDIEGAIASRSNHDLFQIPTTTDGEISFTYQLLKYALEHYKEYYQLCFGYASSTKVQDHVREFNRLVVQPFVNHINDYLHTLMVQRGVGTKSQVTVTNSTIGALNLAQDGAQITSSSIVTVDQADVVAKTAENVLKLLSCEGLDLKMKEEIRDLVTEIENQITKGNPRRSVLQLVTQRLQEFGGFITANSTLLSAILTLIQQVQAYL
ncbi:hypothetical protein [Alicyclobacillus sendaiensis]|uniref:hypothetical protein n=1 Tax=Alicyclobacillus sendaiensis TaxID=192387 RepID=UPI0007823C84|nr:hypothetical protein [Alicyclobacillus sendaiensis]